MPIAPVPCRRRSSRRSLLAAAVSLACLNAAAQAPQDELETITVTGSRIKRIDAESALPVQLLSREDIAGTGVTTAAELLRTVSASTAPLGDGQSITDSTSGQRGFNGANLRGIGVSSTLVLLNGRRLANFASPGDSAGVDLNNIPAGAIERVEVLKDGASAIYGTDAIGGVINFITRTDYEGIDVGLYASATDQGGADKQTATLSLGHGDLDEDRYNVFGVVDLQRLGALNANQREFVRDRPLAERLPALMSSNTYPANVDISTAQRRALITAGLLPAGTTSNRFNPSEPTGCNLPATVDVDEGPGGPNGCSFDYMRDTQIYPESERISVLGRATGRIAGNHDVYLEALYAETVSDYVLSPNPQRIRNLPVRILPEPYRSVLSAPGLPSTFSGIRLRMSEAGNRTSEVTSEATRFVLGLTGRVGAWDYDTAIVRAENDAIDRYVDGYVLYDQFVAGIVDGRINPFGESSAAGQELIRSITIDDEARKSNGVTESIDASLSRSLLELGGGDLGIALGAEYRREEQTFTPSPLLVSNNIAGDRDSSGLSTDLVATEDDRDVFSAYVELNAPLTRSLELQLALRYDDYSEVGDTLNPKLGLRWQPAPWLMLRGSAGTGFRAPSLSDLNRPVIYGTSSSLITDPQCVAQEGSIDLCTDQWPVERLSNPDLEPEESRQYSFGAVIEPNRSVSVSLDYWNIQVDQLISTLGEQIIIESPEKYNGTYIERDADGFITNVILQKENQGELDTSGIDVGLEARTAEFGWGQLSVSVTGTYVLEYERQFGPLEPFRSNLGRFLNDQVVQKWRHRASVGWDRGPLGLLLSNTYSSGYEDQNLTYDPVTDSPLPARNVEAYSLWDITGTWQATDRLQLRAGVLNLADTPPPFSNQAYYFLAGYDPTYTDPRGRSFFAGLNYSF